ncbi:oligosaccharide flippase family protein [Sulfurimonas sediminis]|uniref:Oligosaccharide flippase family protein n=1 Tax=Sulfurimonas sediminis TaxID=2590020 RepID=A0A7M1B0R7_9BACT|nr:oligosaccharide flippase family protein [Sulfurimonas sediminis]QOP43235.1 oligosaccharide flippase family protein [Sulfurimonas sediminis]
MKKQFLLYSISTAINKGAVLLYFPILTQFLTLEEFGKWSLVIVVSSLLIPILSLNGSAAILREGSQEISLGYSLLKKYLLISLLVSGLIILAVYFYFNTNWFFYSLIIAFSEALLLLGVTMLRAEEKAFPYFLIFLFKTFFIFLLIIYAKFQGMPLEQLLLYHFFIVGFFAFMLTIYLLSKKVSKHHSYLFGSILLFGILLIPHGISQWIMSSSDRIIIEYILGSKEVGIYSLAYNLGMVLMLVNSGIALAIPPYMIKNIQNWKENHFDVKISNIYTYFSIVLFVIVLLLYVLDKNYTHILGYYGQEMIPLILIIYLSIYFLGIYYLFANYLFYHKKAYIISQVTLYASILNIVLTIVLTYFLGVLGAAIATLFAYIYYLYAIRKQTLSIEPLLQIPLIKNITLNITILSIIGLGFYYVQ